MLQGLWEHWGDSKEGRGNKPHLRNPSDGCARSSQMSFRLKGSAHGYAGQRHKAQTIFREHCHPVQPFFNASAHAAFIHVLVCASLLHVVTSQRSRSSEGRSTARRAGMRKGERIWAQAHETAAEQNAVRGATGVSWASTCICWAVQRKTIDPGRRPGGGGTPYSSTVCPSIQYLAMAPQPSEARGATT